MGDGEGGHWLVRMEWHPAGWSVCLPLLIFSCTIKTRSSVLAPADLGGPGKKAAKWLWWWWCEDDENRNYFKNDELNKTKLTRQE